MGVWDTLQKSLHALAACGAVLILRLMPHFPSQLVLCSIQLYSSSTVYNLYTTPQAQAISNRRIRDLDLDLGDWLPLRRLEMLFIDS